MSRKILLVGLTCFLMPILALFPMACATNTPGGPPPTWTHTFTPAASMTPTVTPMNTATSTGTGTATPSATASPTPSATSTSTSAPTNTPTQTGTGTFTATPTTTWTPTFTLTPTATATYWFTHTPCATTFVMGNGTPSSPSGSSLDNYMMGLEVQAPNYAEITSVSVYAYGTGNIVAAVYGDNTVNNLPTTFIAQTNPYHASVGGWVTIPLAAPVVVNPGTYWIVAISDTNALLATNGSYVAYWARYTYYYSTLAASGYPNTLVAPTQNPYASSTPQPSSFMMEGLWTCP